MAVLTPKQERFVEEYIVDLNATQAAIRSGYSEKTARSQGQRMLTNVDIREAIEAAQLARSERTNITADRVLTELARIGFSDIRGLFSDSGSLAMPEDWGDDIAAAVSSIEVVTRPTGERDENDRPVIEHVHKLKIWDKNSALEKLGKHLGLYLDRVEQTGSLQIAVIERKIVKASN